MSNPKAKRLLRAREALLKAIVWALACGVKVEEIIAMARTGKSP